VIDPCLRIIGSPTKSMMVDSKPILHCPPSKINLTLFPKSITVLSNLPKNCKTYNSDLIQDRFSKYQNTSKPSFSTKYLNSLVNRNDIPNPKLFDIRKICSEANLN